MIIFCFQYAGGDFNCFATSNDYRALPGRSLADHLPGIGIGGSHCSCLYAASGAGFCAFLASGAMIALLLFSAAAGLYPNLLISTIDPAYNLTIFNAASESNTLTVMLVIALIGLPFVLLYTAGAPLYFPGQGETDAAKLLMYEG